MQRRWFDRLDDKRVQERLTVSRLVALLGLNRASYYEYRNDPSAYPHNPVIVARIAEYLEDDTATLAAEMTGTPAPPLQFLDAAGRSELGVRLYQEHVRALGHVLGLGGDQESLPRRSGVDVVARLLRERLPRPDDPFDVCVIVRPTPRGMRDRYGSSAFRSAHWEPYQYQIYVVPDSLAQQQVPPGTDAVRLLERLRRKVDDILAGTLLPVTREHSSELALAAFAARADVLLYPGLLEMRPPDPLEEPGATNGDVLITGVYYAGAPDVAAMLARATRYGFATFDQLARLQVRAGLRGLPSPSLTVATRRTALAALRQGSTIGPMVWATDDPEILLADDVATSVREFKGRLVLISLSDQALAYAAYRVCCVDETKPSHTTQEMWRQRLRHQQRELSRLVGPGALTYEIDLPTEAQGRPDGTYPDAVDTLFDRYVDAAKRIQSELARD